MDWAVLADLSKADGDVQEDLAESASAAVQATYAGLDWYDHAAITVAAVTSGDIVHGAAQQSAGVTAAYLTRVLREMAPGSPTASTLRLTDPVRMGVASWATAYGRVADTVRFELSKGKPLDEAIKIGLTRADVMARTDLALARRDQSRATFAGNRRVQAFRRVVHPELSRSGTCGLCIAAADRRYNKGALLPIHARCKCTVLPITAAGDPGTPFDMDPAFEEAYGISLSNRAADLKEVRVRVVQNEELGPVLYNVEHRSTNPGRNRDGRQERGEGPLRRPDTRAESQAFRAYARRNL